jgi:hypothetical protein
MKKYTVDVAVTYIQTVEVDADSAEEANATALDCFEVCDATEVRRQATVEYGEPITQGETK